METARAAFETEGFVLFSGMLSPFEVEILRHKAEELFDRAPAEPSWGDAPRLRNEPLGRWPEFRSLVLQPLVRLRLSEIFGPRFVLLPSNSLCDRRYSGWHKDIHGQQKYGFAFQRAADFCAATVLFYLQDNSPEQGGGVDVVPGSHLEADQHAYHPDDLKDGKIRFGESTHEAARVHTIRSHAGDMVVFDIRLNHKATWPAWAGPMDNLYAAEPPQDPRIPRKFLISLKVMPDDHHAKSYLNYFRFMADKEPSMAYLKTAETEFLNLQFA